jgi:hypothetical protein
MLKNQPTNENLEDVKSYGSPTVAAKAESPKKVAPSASADADVKMESDGESETSQLTNISKLDDRSSSLPDITINSDFILDVDEKLILEDRTRKVKKARVEEGTSEEEEEGIELLITEWNSDEVLPVSSSRNTGRPSVSSQKAAPHKEAPQQLSRPKKKDVPLMGFEELCDRMEAGFKTLSGNDKIELLHYMLECCIIDSERFRSFREQSMEKNTALKKEKRENIRERKQMYLRNLI